MSGRDENQLAADVEAWVRSRVEPLGTPASRTAATEKGRAALAELVARITDLEAQVAALTQERDEHAYYRKVQQTFGEEQYARAEAAETALANGDRLLSQAGRELERLNLALATTRQALAAAAERACVSGHAVARTQAGCDCYSCLARRSLADTGGDTARMTPEDWVKRIGAGGDTKEPAWGPGHPSYDEMGQ